MQALLWALAFSFPAAAAPARFDWPIKVPFQVMDTISTLQYYGPTPGFHHGVDFRAPAGTKVYAPVGGRVSHGYYYPRAQIPYTYRVAIEGDDGFRWEFHHIDKSSIPQEVLDAAARGGRVEAGALIAEITGETPAGIPPHLHVDRIDPQGVYWNSLAAFAPLDDREPPRVNGIYVVGEDNVATAGENARGLGSQLKPGRYELVVDVTDPIPPAADGDSVYAIEASANGRTLGSARFDHLPAANYLEGVREIYRIDPFQLPDGTRIANHVDIGKPRNFLYRFPLDLTGAHPGPLRIEVRTQDFAGNVSSARLTLQLTP